MSLDSTETLTNANEGNFENGSKFILGPKGEMYSQTHEREPWCYLFLHHAKVEIVRKKLEEKFCVFIHKTIIYKREKSHIKQDEQPTISGLIFVQGAVNDIQNFLRENFFNIYLVKDCSNKQIAMIPDSVMQSFIQVSQVHPTRIRFMPHTFDYYSKDHSLVRITSGVLLGMEGYRIRIARDKCLITSIGGMTVAISGIHKESFENLDEYVRQQKQRWIENNPSYVALTPIQAEIDKCFFVPRNQLDILAIAENLASWVVRMKSDLESQEVDEKIEIALFILEAVGTYFRTVYANGRIREMKEVLNICREADQELLSVIERPETSMDMKHTIIAGRESLSIHFPFLPIEI